MESRGCLTVITWGETYYLSEIRMDVSRFAIFIIIILSFVSYKLFVLHLKVVDYAYL
jgi:hypothetical protein